jgi:hypothetical protein
MKMKSPNLNRWLDLDSMNSMRANHALEHATFHVLAESGLKSPLIGLSDAGGFWVLGNIPAGRLLDGAQAALERLQGGEVHLAVHENCGTNLATTGVIVGGLAWLGMLGMGRGFIKKVGRLPLVVFLATLGLIIAQPLGPFLQEKVTTLANGRKREIIAVQRYGFGTLTVQRITTRYAVEQTSD